MKNMLTNLVIVILLIGIIITSGCITGNTDTLAKEMQAAYEKIDNYDITFRSDLACDRVETYQVLYVKPDKTKNIFLESDTRQGDFDIYNGNQVLVYYASKNRYRIDNLHTDQIADQTPDFKAMLTQLFEIADVNFIGEEKVENRDTYHIRIKKKFYGGGKSVAGARLSIESIEYWLDKEHFIPVKVVSYDGDKNVVQNDVMTSFKVNEGVLESIFEISAPEGARSYDEPPEAIPHDKLAEDFGSEFFMPNMPDGYEYEWGEVGVDMDDNFCPFKVSKMHYSNLNTLDQVEIQQSPNPVESIEHWKEVDMVLVEEIIPSLDNGIYYEFQAEHELEMGKEMGETFGPTRILTFKKGNTYVMINGGIHKGDTITNLEKEQLIAIAES